MIKGSVHQDKVTIIIIYTFNIRAPQYIKQILTDLKEEIDNDTITVGNFNTPTVING